MHLEHHPGGGANVTPRQNPRLCLKLPEQGVVLPHPQSSTTSVLPLREKEVGQNHPSNRKLWPELPLDREVDQDLLKSLTGNPAHPHRKEVSPILLRTLKPRQESHLGRGVVQDHLQRWTTNPSLLGAVGLLRPPK